MCLFHTASMACHLTTGVENAMAVGHSYTEDTTVVTQSRQYRYNTTTKICLKSVHTYTASCNYAHMPLSMFSEQPLGAHCNVDYAKQVR